MRISDWSSDVCSSDLLHESNYAERVSQALPTLIKQIRKIQADYGLSGQQTALAGFSQGDSMALEASHAKPDLAGRVLAFSGLYAALPSPIPPTTPLHFFHGPTQQAVSANAANTEKRRE